MPKFVPRVLRGAPVTCLLIGVAFLAGFGLSGCSITVPTTGGSTGNTNTAAASPSTTAVATPTPVATTTAAASTPAATTTAATATPVATTTATTPTPVPTSIAATATPGTSTSATGTILPFKLQYLRCTADEVTGSAINPSDPSEVLTVELHRCKGNECTPENLVETQPGNKNVEGATTPGHGFSFVITGKGFGAYGAIRLISATGQSCSATTYRLGPPVAGQ